MPGVSYHVRYSLRFIEKRHMPFFYRVIPYMIVPNGLLVAARTASTSTVYALDAGASFSAVLPLQPGLGYATDTGTLEVGLLGLHAAQTAQFFVALLLPLGDQVGVGVAVLEQPVVQLLGDGLAGVVQVVDVAGAGVGDLEDGPHGLVLLLALV